MYCIQHTLLNNLSYCLFHFTNPILHHIAIRPLIHMGLSDNPTQKKNYQNFVFCSYPKHYTAIFNVRGRGLRMTSNPLQASTYLITSWET